ncbi:MAG: hypothetical protein ABIA66_02660, partial [Candidatus Omnitrophota bacterium]
MFDYKISKNLKKEGGEKEMKIVKLTMVLVLTLGLSLCLATSCFAARITSAPLSVEAEIPTLNEGLSVTVTPVQVSGDVFGTPTPGTITFGDPATGELVPNYAGGIFTSPIYYAVDVGVLDNTGNNWYITTSTSSIKRGTTTDNLDSNVNVSYVKLVKNQDESETQSPILLRVFSSAAVTSTTLLNKAALAGGWLRIYLGLATGVATK